MDSDCCSEHMCLEADRSGKRGLPTSQLESSMVLELYLFVSVMLMLQLLGLVYFNF